MSYSRCIEIFSQNFGAQPKSKGPWATGTLLIWSPAEQALLYVYRLEIKDMWATLINQTCVGWTPEHMILKNDTYKLMDFSKKYFFFVSDLLELILLPLGN